MSLSLLRLPLVQFLIRRPCSRAGVCLALAPLLLLLGCTRPSTERFNLQALSVTGNDVLDDEEIEGVIASRETQKFLGLFSGLIYDYENFNRFVLERDLQRIERLYRSRGYYKARVRAAHVFRDGSSVRVEIVVDEGDAVRLGRVDVHGIEQLPKLAREQALLSVREELPLGEPFDEEAFTRAEKALQLALRDRGYAQVRVKKSADVALPEGTASVGFWVEAGAAAEFGKVSVEGLGDLPEDKVRDALAIREGAPFSESELEDAKRAALDLGVFSSAEVIPQPPLDQGPGRPPRIPLIVRFERAKLRSVHAGGGFQIDTRQTDAHLRVGWEDQSFFGGMRKFMVEVMPGVVFYPTRIPTFQAPERLLPKARVRTEFRQPGFLEGRTTGAIRLEASVQPQPAENDPKPETPIIGYREYRASVGLERFFYRLFSAVSLNAQVSDPFTYKGLLDENLSLVLVTYPELFGILDLRDDSVSPHKGFYASFDAQLGTRPGDASDVKLRPDVRAYIPLSRHSLTLAGRTSIGLLFPSNYGDTILGNALNGLQADTTNAESVRDIQLMFLRGFFAGGSGSNRGYAARQIGPHGTVPFYNPGQTAEATDEACKADINDPVCDLPLGGFTLWEANLELRYAFSEPMTAVLFADAADVSARRMSFRLNRPHLSVGAGLRYGTPVGPIRLDVGYRVPGFQAPAAATDEGIPDDIFGVPIAISLGIGESF